MSTFNSQLDFENWVTAHIREITGAVKQLEVKVSVCISLVNEILKNTQKDGIK